MMVICPNVNLPEWKELVASVGIDGAYRQWISGNAQSEKVNQVQVNLQKILPSSIGLSAIEKLAGDSQAWGAYRNQVIYLANNAPAGTEYHEAFHAVYRLMLSDGEISEYNALAYKEILQEAKNNNTSVMKMILAKQANGYYMGKTPQDALPEYIEEWMADKFQAYMLKPKKNNTWLGQLFSKLRNFVRGLFRKNQEVSMLFRKIEQGKFKNKPFVNNEFNQEDRANETVYKLLSKALRRDADGDPMSPKFGSDETGQIIRDTASYYFDFKNSELAKRDRWTDDMIIDKILDLKKNQYAQWKDDKFLGQNEHDYHYLFSDTDITEPDGTITLGERTELKREVMKYLTNFKRLESLSRDSDDDAVDDVGDKTYLNAEMKNEGGWGTLPQFVREYIARISYPIDTTNHIGFRDNITKEGIPYKEKVYQKKALNPTKVYNGLLRALANELSEEKMIEKLINYGQLVEYIDEQGNLVKDGGNLDTHYFVQQFLKDTKLDVNKLLDHENLTEKEKQEGYVPNDDLNANLVFQKVLKGFNRWAKNTVFTEIDTTTKEAKVYLANRKNVAQQQFEQWASNYNNRTGVDTKELAAKLTEIVPLFQESRDYYKDQIAGEDFDETIKREEKLAKDIGKVKQTLLAMGMDLSPNFIKYSLLYPKLIKFQEQFKDKEKVYSRDTLTLEEYKFLTTNEISRVNRLKYEDFVELSKTLAKGSNPYQKSEAAYGDGIDDANIGRIQNIAKGNAVLDETVFESSYVAADGTMRYLHQDGTYHLKAIGKLRDPKFIEQLRTMGIRDTNINIGVDSKGDPINIDDIDKEFVTNNFLFSPNSDFLKIVERLRIEELDGIKMTSTQYDDNGEIETITSREGVHFGEMTEREFLVTLLNMYGNPKNFELDENNNKITVVPQLISVMETSKSSDFVYLPVVKGLYDDKGPTDKMVEITRNELEKEYNRINKTFNEINQDGEWKSTEKIQNDLGFVLDAYHTGGPDARGLKVTDKLVSLFSPEFIKDLQAAGRTKEYKQWFTDNQSRIDTEIKQGLKRLNDKTLDLIADSGAVSNGEKGVTNNFLSKVYFEGSEALGFTTNFEQNIGQVNMQQWINTLAFSHLLHGDNALMYKNDGADPYKREKPNNAKIVSFKHNRNIPKLGVTPFQYSRMVILEEPKDISKLFPKGDKIDQADAQMWGSVQAIRNSLFGLGRLTPDIAKLLDKMERGESLTAKDLFDANGEIINQDRFINSFKFVFKDSKRTVKMSVVALTKELTSDLVDGKWQAKPGREELHKMREAMEGKDNQGRVDKTKAFDFVGPKSAFKTYRANILKGSNNTYDYTQARPEMYDNEYFGLQLENPSNKVKITTPTQLLHAIDNEQNDDTTTYLIGGNQELSIKQVRQGYQKALANKSRVMFEGAKAEMYEIGSLSQDLNKLIQEGKIAPRLARFQQKALENLQSTGADPQLLEFFEVIDGRPTQNLNNDLVIEKYTQLYLAHFSKGAFSLKNPGHAVALFSNFSMGLVKQVVDIKEDGHVEWRVIRTDSDEYKRIIASKQTIKPVSWTPRASDTDDIRYVDANLNYGDIFMDKPAYNVPEYKDGKIVGYFSEAILPFQTADQVNLVGNGEIPESIRYMFGNRIPLQDKHSMLSMRWVDTMPLQYGSTGVFPSEIVQLSGADFDIDKLFISTFDTYQKDGKFYRYGEKEDKTDQFTEYLKWQLKNNKFLKSFITEFKNQDERYGLLTDQLWGLRTKIKGIQNSQAFKDNIFAQELVEVMERALGITYDEDGNQMRSYNFDSQDAVAIASEEKLQRKIKTLYGDIERFDPTLNDMEYYQNLVKDINDTLTYYEYSYLHQAIEKYAPTMPSNIEAFDNLYNTGAANNTILKSMLSLLTNDYVRNGIADQPATQDYLKTGGNRESDKEMNPAFIREDGTHVFGSQEKYPIDSMIGHVTVKKKNNIGKDNIGIDVSGNVQNTLLKKGKVEILNPQLQIKIYSPQLKENIVFNSFAPTQEIDMATGQQTGRRIMDVTSTKISSSTDEAKDGNNAKFNLGSEASQVVSILNGLGVPLEICIALVNQPIFQQMPAKYKANGLALEEETKYQDPEKFADDLIASLEKLLDMENAEEEDQEFMTAQIAEYGSLDHLFTFENLAKILREDGKHSGTQTAEERVTYNLVTLKAADMYTKAQKLAGYRASIGDVLKLNKGLKDFNVLTKALVSAKKLGLMDGEIEKDFPFDVRFMLTGDKSYPSNTDYIHETSIAYLNQSMQLYSLSKLNFVNRTATVNEMRSRLTSMMDLRVKDAPILEKDMLSFITLASYKNLVEQSETFSNALLVGMNDDNIIDLFKEVKEMAPNNPLMKYILPNKKRGMDGKPFNTLEANSFTRLTDIQLGNLINGFMELYSDPNTNYYATALFDYLLVKDGMQFKNKSISKVFPGELFTKISQSTDIAHKLLLADSKDAYLRVARELNMKYPEKLTEADLDELAGSSDVIIKNTVYDRVFGYNQEALYNRFTHLIHTQPAYKNKVLFTRVQEGKTTIRPIKDGYMFKVSGTDMDKTVQELRRVGLSGDAEKGVIFYPKFIRTKLDTYVITDLDGKSNPNGLDLPFTTEMIALDDPRRAVYFRGRDAVYMKVLTNKNEQWNQMADLNDLRLVKSENSVKLAEPQKEVNIWYGSSENTNLSNLASRPFTDKQGRKYLSVEHAYQSWKSGKFDVATYNKYTVAGVKIQGNLGTKTEDNYNIKAMKGFMKMSFEQNPTALQELIATGDRTLTHTQDNGIWKEQFPKLLMEVRNELKDYKAPEVKEIKEEVKLSDKDKIIFGHPGIGKTFVRESRKDIIDFDTDYKPQINKEFNLEPGFKALNHWRTANEEPWKDRIRNLWEQAVAESKRTGKLLVASDMILLREYANDFDKVITISKDDFINRAKQRDDYTKGNTEVWKENLDKTIKNVDKNKLITTDKYLSDLLPKEEAKPMSIDDINLDDLNSYEEGDSGEDIETEFNYKGTNKTVQQKVVSFMKDLNVDVQHFETLKDVTGYDAVSAVDLLNKVALFGANADARAYSKEAAYVAYSFLGRKNKIVTDLKFNIENIDNYKTIYDSYKSKNPNLGDYKIKELIVIDFIADSIQENFETPKDSYINREAEFWSIKGNSALEKRLKYYLMKIKRYFNTLFSLGKLSHENLKALADDIANDVLTKNYSKFQRELKPEQQLTNYNETIANDPKALDIVTKFQDMGIVLTGSLAIRKQGTLYRSKDETLHDLDFTVQRKLVNQNLVDDLAKLEKEMEGASDLGKATILDWFIKNLNKNLLQYDWFQKVKEVYPEFTVTNSFSGLQKGDITISGTIGDYIIDFFILTQQKDEIESKDKGFLDWKKIFAAKIKMGRAKDMLDFVNFKPFEGQPDMLAQESGFRHFTFSPFKNKDNTVDNTKRCD